MGDRNTKDGKDENESRRQSPKSQRIKKNEIKKLKEHVCDSDSCECHCQERCVREGPRRKACGGSKHSKGRSKKTPMIPCSSSEACEYDREHGEDDEDEGEGTQGEHPELSSLLNDLCHAKYGNNSSETTCNSPKCSGIHVLKNCRDLKTVRVSQRSAMSADNQSMVPPASSPVEGTSRGQATSQTCDFMSGLHYAIPFLSDRLKSSLLNRLRCDSEPRETEQVTESANTLEAEDCGIDDLSDLCDTENNSDSEITHNQHLPPFCHDNQIKQIPSPCPQTNHDNLPFCHKDDRSRRLEKKLPGVLDDHDKTPFESGEFQNGPSILIECNFDPLCQNGDSQEYHDAGYRGVLPCEDHYHGDWGTTLEERNEGSPCFPGSLSYDSDEWDSIILHSGEREAGQKESSMGTAASQGMMGNSESQEDEIESAVQSIAKDVGKIDFLEHVLEGGEDQLSSGNSSEMIPDLFSSLSSDSCQADDEFECDCGHCVGSMPGHNENDPDLNWQTADGLESSEREDNSSPSVINVGFVLPHEEREDGVYEFTLLTAFEPEELEVMFEAMVAEFQDVHFADEDEQAPPPASSSTIDSLPYNSVTAQQIDDLAPCSICLASFVVMDTSSHLPCNHLFHLHCIKAWLSKSASCPVCRSRVESPTNP